MVSKSENLPESAEVTLLKTEDGTGHLFCIVNAQTDLPPVPLHGVELALDLPFPVRKVVRVSDGAEVPFRRENGVIAFSVPEIREGEFFHFI